MAWRRMGRLVVTVHSSEVPDEGDWDEYIGQVDAVLPLESQRILVISAGGGPNALQRAKMTDVLDGAKVPVAIMTNSWLMRGAGIAVSWFNPSLRIFGARSLEPAQEYLNLTAWERLECVEAARDLQRELGIEMLELPEEPEPASVRAQRRATK